MHTTRRRSLIAKHPIALRVLMVAVLAAVVVGLQAVLPGETTASTTYEVNSVDDDADDKVWIILSQQCIEAGFQERVVTAKTEYHGRRRKVVVVRPGSRSSGHAADKVQRRQRLKQHDQRQTPEHQRNVQFAVVDRSDAGLSKAG